MSRFGSSLLLCAALLTPACSGASFGVASDTGSDETSAQDASDGGDDTAVADTSGDSSTGDANDGGDDTSVVVDSGVADSATDTSPDAPVDTCSPNACGGCAPLPAKPNDPCGIGCGGGTYACDGTDALICKGATQANACGGCATLPGVPGSDCAGACGGKYECAGSDTLLCNATLPKNACGGCATLAAQPGAACGAGCGKYACNGLDAVVCQGDVPKNSCGGCTPLPANPGDACGVGCGGGKYACNGTDTLKCDGATMANVCGGCTALAHAPGGACGQCNSGTYICDPNNKEATICVDPVTNGTKGATCPSKCNTGTLVCSSDKQSLVCFDPITTPAVGTTCTGKCGGAQQATYQCNASNTATVCVDPVSGPAPGTSCGGTCGTAKYQCDPTASGGTKCVDPVTGPAVGTKCAGVCDTATYQCIVNASTTQCLDPVPAGSPTPGAKCGICQTKQYQCSGGNSVVCAKEDDRLDAHYPNQTFGNQFAGYDLDRITQLEVPFTILGNQTKVVSVGFSLGRKAYGCEFDVNTCTSPDPKCSCNCSTNVCTVNVADADSLTVELWQGTPASPVAKLDSATATPTSVPLIPSVGYPATVFTFTKDLRLAAGTNVFFRLIAAGKSWAYGINGSADNSPNPFLYFRQGGVAMQVGQYSPYAVATETTCN